MSTLDSPTVAVIGLGYVGLPLTLAFGKKFRTIGFDIDAAKVESCQGKVDPNSQVLAHEFFLSPNASFSNNVKDLSLADVLIVTVPTPVTDANIPDLSILKSASKMLGEQIRPGVTIVFESTVFPGATEEVCIPVIEQASSLKWKEDFFVGYSPERINPGDRAHTISTIKKVVSGDTPKTLELLASLYGSVIEAGVYRAASIKVAEASKAIENTQRDLNISLINEFAIICHLLGIDTTEVLEAAASKWNFLKFEPGLVGGHCISVDPYYLTYKAESLGYHPQVIKAGRRINDQMARYVAQQTIKLMIRSGTPVFSAPINILGFTFKEDCPDIRNTRVIDLLSELKSFGVDVRTFDPLANREHVLIEYGVSLTEWDEMPQAEGLVIAVSHQFFRELPLDVILRKLRPGGVLVDVKGVLSHRSVTDAGFVYWRL